MRAGRSSMRDGASPGPRYARAMVKRPNPLSQSQLRLLIACALMMPLAGVPLLSGISVSA